MTEGGVEKLVVTGAAGFLGGRTSKYFGDLTSEYNVIATSRRTHRKSELESHHCEFASGDLSDSTFCKDLVKGVDTVIHCAALSSPFGSYEPFYQSNFVSTKNLIDACIEDGVKRFIYISTPSIYINYSNRINISEDDPLPEKMVNNYAKTKLMAEKYVLGQNGKSIQTIALRPRAIIGAEDTVIFPRVLKAYDEGKLKIIGNGKNICDLTCVRNVIEAIKCCIDAPEDAYGIAYNITDGDPINFWEGLNHAFNNLDLPPPSKRVNKSLAMLAARVAEINTHLFNQGTEPALTRYGISQISNSFTLDISKAKEILRYKPVMNTFEGIDEFTDWNIKYNQFS
ncbi:MAG: NAD-dependent epimerase/dehydratase family protein [bacterium]|nr:NAD-dependent epimerase/dehydratase family protein [bacterium]